MTKNIRRITVLVFIVFGVQYASAGVLGGTFTHIGIAFLIGAAVKHECHVANDPKTNFGHLECGKKSQPRTDLQAAKISSNP